MSKIVFDIETIGSDFESLPADEQEYLLKNISDEKEIEKTKNKLALWPFTGEITAICLLNPETKKGKTYFQAPAEEIEPFSENGIEYEPMEEKEILLKFWQDIKNYRQFITFNGRLFDCPYIILRSAILGVKPTKNLMPYRFDASLHIDLLDQLTFYGAFRKFSLDYYCKSFKLENQKMEGIAGDKVTQFFKDKKYVEIAKYCAADVKATAELYEKWIDFIQIK